MRTKTSEEKDLIRQLTEDLHEFISNWSNIVDINSVKIHNKIKGLSELIIEYINNDEDNETNEDLEYSDEELEYEDDMYV